MGKFIDSILGWLKDMVIGVLLLLPESPFKDLRLESMPEFGKVMGWINYFVPIGTMLGIFTTYLAGILIWYGVRWFLRLAQYID
ncbi:hypothetical protein [Acinetobacter baumannii]|uniref:hypothetical protein n=1 Tax=Acinetobacter baumannii TaxID=470 RepID=UPI002B22F0D6|nr:hypothetical protein [Acinetobacter baumannii]